MTIRLKAKYKFCKLYKTDIWGKIFIKKKVIKFTKIKAPRPRTNISIGNFKGIMVKRSRYFRKRRTRYGKNLAAKQRLLKFYGSLKETKFKKYLLESKKKKQNVLNNTIDKIEKRLDVIIFRSHLVSSIFDAKSYILHKKVIVNNKTINKPSYQMNETDKVSFIKNYKLWKKLKRTKFVWGYNAEHLYVNWKTLKINLHSKPKITSLIFPFKVKKRRLLEFFKI